MIKSTVFFILFAYASVADCQFITYGMSKQQVFELIGGDKMKREIRRGSRDKRDTTYYAFGIKIAFDNISKWDKEKQTYVKIREIGGWVGDYDWITFEKDSLISYRWKTDLIDTTIAYQARFEIFFSFMNMMSTESIPYIPQRSPYFYPAPKGTYDVSSKHPWGLWSNDKVTYELHFYTKSILLEMYQGPPKDRD